MKERSGKVLTVIYSCGRYLLPANNNFCLNELQELLMRNGIKSTRGKGSLIVGFSDCKFQLYANGKIGLAFLKPTVSPEDFEVRVLDFFQEKFGKECIKKIGG
jgi:hypothetical protein